MSTEQEQAAERRDAERLRYVEANVERTRLREQAWDTHVANLTHEERRYQADLDQIDRVYKLRTESTP